ncbi:hypothetical protein MMC25_001906 [Agyrium rufum]|nr:hypothetical protein [Agyrium rufum]
MAEEDNFDIDIYGDGGEDYQQEEQQDQDNGIEESIDKPSEEEGSNPPQDTTYDGADEHMQHNGPPIKEEDDKPSGEEGKDVAQKIASTDETSHNSVNLPKQAPQTQGLKRKEGAADDRPLDPGATSALFLADLHWWITDDDIRGWANQSQCEDELDEITFGEHKINGKSKGQSYLLFKTPQAATAAKHKIESFGEGQHYARRFTVTYTNPFTNPFKTTHKDSQNRNNNNQNNRSASASYSSNTGGMPSTPQSNPAYNNPTGGYRGRGGYNNNRGMSTGGTGYTNNRGGGYQPQTVHTNMFQPQPTFQPQMTGMQTYGGFNNNRGGMMGNGMRGGNMGMRGGRGGPMMNMGMGGMNMGGMPTMGAMGMGMPAMGMAMQGNPGGFGGPTPHYNPTFFPQQQQPQGDWNPHGAKRTRQE